jgi:hypothetical protein
MNDSDIAALFGVGFVIIWFVVMLASMALGVYLYTRIAKKAGWPWTYGLLMFVPIANTVFMIMFVFMKWPIEAEVEALRAQVHALGGGPTWYQPGVAGGTGSPAPYGAQGAPSDAAQGAPSYGAAVDPIAPAVQDDDSWLPPQDQSPVPPSA